MRFQMGLLPTVAHSSNHIGLPLRWFLLFPARSSLNRPRWQQKGVLIPTTSLYLEVRIIKVRDPWSTLLRQSPSVADCRCISVKLRNHSSTSFPGGKRPQLVVKASSSVASCRNPVSEVLPVPAQIAARHVDVIRLP